MERMVRCVRAPACRAPSVAGPRPSRQPGCLAWLIRLCSKALIPNENRNPHEYSTVINGTDCAVRLPITYRPPAPILATQHAVEEKLPMSLLICAGWQISRCRI